MDDAYESVSVHGVMPLVAEPGTGKLRFARIGIDRPDECLVSPGELPEAEVDLFVFSGSDKLAVWRSAVSEFAGNAVETVVPEIPWPRFALLVRHDRAPRRAATLEEAIALRDPYGAPLTADSVRKAGREARLHAARLHGAAMAKSAFRREWAAELAALALVPEAEDVSSEADAYGGLSFGVSVEGEIRGVGPTFSLARAGSGYEASWKPYALRMDDAALARVDEAMARMGARREGGTVRAGLERLDRPALLRLTEIDAAFGRCLSCEDDDAPGMRGAR